ncbi:MAG: TIGR04255 family protein [Terriglobia bacterium]|nr:MAG: TIGR04255 family protein [Terriglobia bacterium]
MNRSDSLIGKSLKRCHPGNGEGDSPSDRMACVNAGQLPGTAASDSPFPPSPRTIYHKNPLAEVVCQVQFPTLLRVDVEPPAEYQERIRSDYPVLKDKSNELLGLPPDLPPLVASLLRSPAARQKPQAAYDFVSEDGIWTVSLTRNFLALATTKYHTWEQFKEHLARPLKALIDVYTPSWFSRVGLRYQDLVRRSTLNLTDRSWSELLKQPIAGLLAAPDLKATVIQTLTQTLIQLPDGIGNVNLRHGLIQSADNGETCYLIDNDFFTDQQTRPTDVYAKLDYFNRQSGRLFRWCITNILDKAMEPELVAPAGDGGHV